MKHKKTIEDIFFRSEYYNLRLIKQAILDFDYFYVRMDEKYKNDDVVMHNLIYEFFIFFEKIKNLTLEINSFETTTQKTNTEDGSLFPFSQWREILYEGKINKESINTYLEKLITIR
jgi:hypothetical protein